MSIELGGIPWFKNVQMRAALCVCVCVCRDRSRSIELEELVDFLNGCDQEVMLTEGSEWAKRFTLLDTKA